MRTLILFCVFATLATVTVTAQTQLSRTVIGSGGVVGGTNGVAGSPALSATIGEPLISVQTRPDGNSLYQGFWLPLIGEVVSVDDGGSDAIAGELTNYPNPFSSQTTIRFSVPMDGRVTVRVFSITGDLVRTITADVSAAGSQEISLSSNDENGSPLANGIYLYEVEGTTASGTPFRRMQRLNILR